MVVAVIKAVAVMTEAALVAAAAAAKFVYLVVNSSIRDSEL